MHFTLRVPMSPAGATSSGTVDTALDHPLYKSVIGTMVNSSLRDEVGETGRKVAVIRICSPYANRKQNTISA